MHHKTPFHGHVSLSSLLHNSCSFLLQDNCFGGRCMCEGECSGMLVWTLATCFLVSPKPTLGILSEGQFAWIVDPSWKGYCILKNKTPFDFDTLKAGYWTFEHFYPKDSLIPRHHSFFCSLVCDWMQTKDEATPKTVFVIRSNRYVQLPKLATFVQRFFAIFGNF